MSEDQDLINPNLDGGTDPILFRPFGWQSNNRMAIKQYPHLPCGMLIATPWVAISIPQGK